MALFNKNDRIAIACIAIFIVIGWGLRLVLNSMEEPDNLRVIRNAVKLPSALNPSDSLNVELHQIYSAVDINKTVATELETLPMIGPVKAAAIVEYREKHGNFTRLSDIMKVQGIGPATYKKIYNYITITPDSLQKD